MLKHEPHRVYEMFLSLNLELLASIKMLPTRLHTRPSSIVHLSSENRVQNSRRASSPQSIHITVHVRPANFTGTCSPSVFDLQIEGERQSRLISV